jgi:hypothetical protein
VTEYEISHAPRIAVTRHSAADERWRVEVGDEYLRDESGAVTSIEYEAGLWPLDEAFEIADARAKEGR